MGKNEGRFVWYELMTTEPEAAKAFYTELVGWTVQRWEDAQMDYAIWQAGDQGVGGVMALPEPAKAAGAPPHWMPYVDVADLDAAVAEVERLGGEIVVPPMAIPNVGRFATFRDPQGAHLSLHEGLQTEEVQAWEPPTGLGAFVWHELYSPDPDAALAFYQALFGWEVSQVMDMGEMGAYTIFGKGGTDLGGIMRAPDGQPPAWLSYTAVDEIDERARRAQELGATLIMGPMDVPGGGRIAMFLDPQGAAFALVRE